MPTRHRDHGEPVAAGGPTVRLERHRLDPQFPLRAVEWTLGDAPITSLHRHSALELGVCLGGSGTYIVAGKTYRFATGWSLVVGPQEGHYSRSDPGTTSSWRYIFVDPEPLLAGLRGAAGLVDHRTVGGSVFVNLRSGEAALSQRIAALAEAALRPTPLVGEVVGLLSATLAELGRQPGRIAARPADDARLAPAWRLLATGSDPGHDLPSVSALANACALSEKAFRRAFTAETGVPPLDFLNAHRLDLAALRLRDPHCAIVTAAAAAGYVNLSSFARAYRRRFGHAPSQFRD